MDPLAEPAENILCRRSASEKRPAFRNFRGKQTSFVHEARPSKAQVIKFEDLSKTIMLRANGTGSQNQSVDCGPSLKETLETGCTTGFDVIETGETCANDPSEPFHCVSASTGGKVGQINNLDTYFIGTSSTCTAPNRWSQINGGAAIDPTDRRLVKVFVTSFDSFANQNGTNTSYKILGFAFMYVTGWQAQNNYNGPCAAENEPSPDPAYNKGSVWGHFVSFAGVNLGDTTPGPNDCNFSDPLRGCIAVLTD
jgi:hypothetical protein